ncbi:hypothetical protein AMTRI_Chr05g59190 [Amborella trichopoda]
MRPISFLFPPSPSLPTDVAIGPGSALARPLLESFPICTKPSFTLGTIYFILNLYKGKYILIHMVIRTTITHGFSINWLESDVEKVGIIVQCDSLPLHHYSTH